MTFWNFINFLPKEEIIGIDPDSNSPLVARIVKSANRYAISELIELPQETEMQAHIQDQTICSVFCQNQTLVRTHEVELVKSKDIEQTLVFEIEPILPYPIETAIFDKVIVEKQKTKTKLSIFATQKQDVQNHLDACSKRSVKPDYIIPKACALAEFCKHFFPEEKNVIVLDITDFETTLTFVHNGKPLVARSIAKGLNDLPTDDALDQDSLDHLHAYLRELARILLSLQQCPECDPDDFQKLPLVFTSKICARDGLKTLITTFLQRNECSAPTCNKIQHPATMQWNQIAYFASVIGACFCTELLSKKMQVANFRKDEFETRALSKTYKKELISYFSLMLLVTCGLYAYLDKGGQTEKYRLIEKYSELLVALGQPIPEDITSYSLRKIDEKLSVIETSLEDAQDAIQLHPDVPRVSDILLWLSNHPQVKNGIELESLHYVFVKRPEKGKVKEHYQIRVDLEFSAPSATIAREFHDALLTPNAMLDSKGELKWSVQRGRYLASFFLKDKTYYPSMSSKERY